MRTPEAGKGSGDSSRGRPDPDHGDRRDPVDADPVQTVGHPQTVIVAPEALQNTVRGARILKNKEPLEVLGVGIEAVAKYSLEGVPPPGQLFHVKGRGNGYLLTRGGQKVYLSEDMACTPGMKALRDIEVAFVSMNLSRSMPPREAAACVNAFKPRAVCPCRCQGSDLKKFQNPIRDPRMEARILDWYP